MPIGFVMTTLNVAISEGHTTCYARKQRHFADICVLEGTASIFIRSSQKTKLKYASEMLGNAEKQQK